jgi:hypothetical protein
VYDLIKLGKPHWSSLLGLTLFFLAMAAKLFLAEQAGWLEWVDILFG